MCEGSWRPYHGLIRFHWLALLSIVPILSGCQHEPAGMKDLVRVAGRVTLNRQPLPDVTVVFDHPDHAETFGRTDADGFYEMSYTTSQKGAFLGTNRVYFSSIVTVEKKPERVPGEYLRQTSTLTVEVTGDTSTYNFDLVSASDVSHPEPEVDLEGVLKPL